MLPGTETVDGYPRELAVLAARTLGEGLSAGSAGVGSDELPGLSVAGEEQR